MLSLDVWTVSISCMTMGPGMQTREDEEAMTERQKNEAELQRERENIANFSFS